MAEAPTIDRATVDTATAVPPKSDSLNFREHLDNKVASGLGPEVPAAHGARTFDEIVKRLEDGTINPDSDNPLGELHKLAGGDHIVGGFNKVPGEAGYVPPTEAIPSDATSTSVEPPITTDTPKDTRTTLISGPGNVLSEARKAIGYSILNKISPPGRTLYKETEPASATSPSTEAITPPIEAVPAVATAPAEAPATLPVETSVAETSTPAVEPAAPATEATTEPTPSTESTKAPESTESSEKLVKMAEIGGKLTKLGIDTASDEGKSILKDLSENPDLVDGFNEKLDKAKADGDKISEFVKGLGYPFSEADATKLTLGHLIDGLSADVTKLTEETGSDTEDVKKKNILVRILIATLKGIGKATIAVATGVGVGTVAGGAAAIGAMSGKR